VFNVSNTGTANEEEVLPKSWVKAVPPLKVYLY
jgi:hypothetical protein